MDDVVAVFERRKSAEILVECPNRGRLDRNSTALLFQSNDIHMI